MEYEFQKFTKTGRSYIPRVSIRSSGQLGISSGAVKRYNLEQYDYAILYYDDKNKVIGIKPINEPEEGALKIRKPSVSYDISAKSFFDRYEIPYEETKQYKAEWDSEYDMIIVKINMEKENKRD